MEPTGETISLIVQIFGIFIVLLSQVRFGYRAWRNYGSFKKAFFQMVSVIRIKDERKAAERSEEELKRKFPEWWTLVEYLHEDLWSTAIGLVVTLCGLSLELLFALFG